MGTNQPRDASPTVELACDSCGNPFEVVNNKWVGMYIDCPRCILAEMGDDL